MADGKAASGAAGAWCHDAPSWSFILYRYLPRLSFCSLVWEVGQLPLYTLWNTGHPDQIFYALVHCTAGDAMIGLLALASALTLARAGSLAMWPRLRVLAITISLALVYTVFSERINTALGYWTYAEAMPVLPWLDIGLTPLLQWLVVPLTAWWWADRPGLLQPLPSG